MNPHAPASTSLTSLVHSMWIHRDLIVQMTKRDIIGRYKGSVLGLVWSFINPVLLLIMYTLVFSVVFKARWGGSLPETKMQFAIILFTGMLVHSLFSETLLRAPSLILENVSYVKKIVFPLEILPVIAMGVSVFHAIVNIVVLGMAVLLINGYLPWTVLLLPIVLLPLIVFSLGIAWGLASLGVFIRDVAQPISLAVSILLFASPVFYPISALPEQVRPWLMLNPLTFIIEQARGVLIFGHLPDSISLLTYYLVALAAAWGGYAWFQKTRKGFANVL